MNRRTVFALLSLSFVSACGPSFSMLSSGTTLHDKDLTVVPVSDWNQGKGLPYQKNTVMLTANGLGVDEVLIFAGVKDGETLLKSAKKLPTYRKDMLPNEVMELVRASYVIQYDTPIVNVSNLQPTEFAGTQGFQFDYAFTSKDEVKRHGRAIGGEINGKLYLMLLDAAATYYYDELLPKFEQMAKSARVKT
ncbi:hypothetical protein [Kordiimonas marina]|uniref:hypothetical protein n=1 Tax=Kordiimonas marina TaxID=2872312 RepID=UPI001FF6C372|nr:hypothetical protein [Kordiimonas marina]MCJ9429207.1 hypothetical protein [Kordiimonas marina]